MKQHEKKRMLLRSLGTLLVALAVLGCSAAVTDGGSGPSAPSTGNEFEDASYRPYTLAEASKDHPAPDRSADVTLSALITKYRVRAAFLGEVRPLRPEVREVIGSWGKSMRAKPEFTERFQHEILVREGESSYHLPIQEPVLAYLPTEVPEGALVDLFLMFIGSTKTEHVFLVNDFEAVRDAGR